MLQTWPPGGATCSATLPWIDCYVKTFFENGIIQPENWSVVVREMLKKLEDNSVNLFEKRPWAVTWLHLASWLHNYSVRLSH